LLDTTALVHECYVKFARADLAFVANGKTAHRKPPQAPAAQPAQPRLRVLAGPNGSGKSTIKSDLKPQWIGVFVNADEMERDLVASAGFLSLRSLGVSGDQRAFERASALAPSQWHLDEKRRSTRRGEGHGCSF
jgi:hypothetical protein